MCISILILTLINIRININLVFQKGIPFMTVQFRTVPDLIFYDYIPQ